MLVDGFLITLFGMFSVFIFLYLLMLTIQLMSWSIHKTMKTSSNLEQVAVAIAVALKQKGE